MLCSLNAWAYPNFIGLGYTSCLTCHYNPMGNGPLTDYGRALGATTVSDRIFWDKETSEDEIGQKSGFLYRQPSLDWIRPSLNYRGLELIKSYGQKSQENEYITMQASANVVLRFGPQDNKDKFIIVLEGGYAPTPRSNKSSTEENYRSREHYIGYRFNQSWGLYAGLMDKAYGIRVPDHIAFSRISTQTTMNDQTHGLMIHFTKPEYEWAAHFFAGNLSQEAALRVKGASLTGEYTLNHKVRLGGSLMTGKSTYLDQSHVSTHARLGFGKGNSIMGEIGLNKKTILNSQSTTNGRYAFLQGHVMAKRGLFTLLTTEYYVPNTELKNEVMRIGPGFQYFPSQGIELRVDIYNTRVFSQTSVSEDSWDLTGQVHLWF